MRYSRRNPPTLAQACAAWIDRKVAAGRWGERSTQRAREDLALFAASSGDRSVVKVGGAAMREFLARMNRRGLAPASQKTRWATVAELGRFCWRQGWIAQPWAALVDPDDLPWRGKRARLLMGRGKPQLAGKTAALQYLAAAMALPKASERVAALLPLLAGMRSGEVLHLHCRDIDPAAGVIWIRSEAKGGWSVKSASSARAAPLPVELATDLAALCQGVPETAYLLRSRTLAKAHKPVWLIELVSKVCALAGLPLVPPHGLRGTAASILAAAKVANVQIGAFLGHSDQGQTAKDRYIGSVQCGPALGLGDNTDAGQARVISLQPRKVTAERETGFEPALVPQNSLAVAATCKGSTCASELETSYKPKKALSNLSQASRNCSSSPKRPS